MTSNYRVKVKAAFDSVGKETPFGRIYTGDDLVKVEVPRPQHGDTWGNWTFDQKRLVLEFKNPNNGWWYEVDLERIPSPADLWAWLMAFTHKTTRLRSPSDIGDLVEALDDVLRHLWVTTKSNPTERIRELYRKTRRPVEKNE